MASQITSTSTVYSTVYSGADQRKHQSSTSPAYVQGIHRWPVNSQHKWPVTRKMFPLVTSSCTDNFWVVAFSANLLLWWLWQCVLHFIIIIKSEVWIFCHYFYSLAPGRYASNFKTKSSNSFSDRYHEHFPRNCQCHKFLLKISQHFFR